MSHPYNYFYANIFRKFINKANGDKDGVNSNNDDKLGVEQVRRAFFLMIFMHGFIFYVNMVTFTILNTLLIISNREEADNMGKGLKDSVSRILGTTHSLEQVRSLSLF